MRTLKLNLGKRFLAIFLSLLLIISILPIPSVSALENKKPSATKEAAATTDPEEPGGSDPEKSDDPIPATYTITPVAGENGSVLINGKSEPVEVEKGTAVSISVTANEQFKISSLAIGEEAITLTKNQATYTNENYVPTGDVTVSASFERIQYMVTITQPAQGAGTVTLGESSTAATINAGESALLSVAPSENYHIASITVKYSNNTEENIEFEDPKNYADNFTPTDDGTLTVTFAIDQFTLNVKVNGRGSVASDGIMINVGGEHDFAVDVNTELTFAVQPVWGNRLSRITLNDDSVNLEDELIQQGGSWSYTTPKITADTSLVFTFEDNNSVTPKKGEELDNEWYSVEFAWQNGNEETKPVPVQKNVDEDGNLIAVVLPENAKVVFKPAGDYTKIKSANENSWTWKDEVIITKGEASLVLAVTKGIDITNPLNVNVPFAIFFDTTDPTVSVTVDEDATPKKDVYNSDVPIKVTITDDVANIKSASYRVYSLSDPDIQSGVIELEPDPSHSTTWTGKFDLIAENANQNDIRVEVTAVNEVERTGTAYLNLSINTTPPAVSMAFFQPETDGEGNTILVEKEINDEVQYFQGSFDIVVTVWDKDYSLANSFAQSAPYDTAANSFAQSAPDDTATGGTIKIETEREKLETVFNKLKFEAVKDEEGKIIKDEYGRTKYQATFTLTEDSNYTISNLTYVNLAGSTASVDAKYKLTVDNTNPTGTIEIGDKTWSDVLKALTFGIIQKNEACVTLSGEDATSPFSLSYYISKGREAQASLSTDDLSEKTWTSYSGPFCIPMPEQAVVYLRVTDSAGNVSYIQSQGIIVEEDKPSVTVAPVKEAPSTGFYNLAYSEENDGNVQFAINVSDLDKVPSGIASVNWYYTTDGKTKGGDTPFSFEWREKENNSYDSISKTFSLDTMYVDVPMAENNSNNVVVWVVVTDNAGNKTTVSSDVIKIDTVAPTIHVSYDKNGQQYYNSDRTATVTIEEVNFGNRTAVNTSITNTDGVIPTLGGWTDNGATHKANIVFHADGDYNFSAVTYTDEAGNVAANAVFENVTDRNQFTIDQTLPTITVSYDNNNAANDKYFNAPRTATVTVNEHNFDPSRVIFTPAQNVSWNNYGDTHTATITYSTDGDYTFDVTATDLANNNSEPVNYGSSVAPTDFTVDMTFEDMVTISAVEDGKAYSYKDVVIPDVMIEDTNFDTYEVTLAGVQRGNTVDLTDEVNKLVDENENGITALFDVFRKTANFDGIYTLYVKGVDLAGNVDEEQIRFTVNRFGSVYEYSDSLLNLIANGGAYNQSIDEDLTFTIYNASPIDPNNVSVVITRDGRPVEAIFTVVETTADGDGWYSYLVTIDKGNFAEDGVYTVSVTTTDDADNTVENTVDNSDGDILFYVDSTAPQLTSVSGLEERIVNAPELEVSYTVYDTIGLASVQVKVDGEIVDTATDFDDASNYSGKFTINEKSSEQHVSFVLTDKAGNVTESDAEGFEVPYTLEKDVTVSTNLFVRWFANKPLFFGGIGGGVAVLGGLGVLFGWKKKKTVKVS